MNWRYFFTGVLFLLVSAFLDNSRGTLIPIWCEVFGVTYREASLVLVLGSSGALISSLALIPLIRRYSVQKLSVAACLWVVMTLFAARWVYDFQTLLVFGFALGTSYILLGTLCSLLVIEGSDHHSRARALSGLHMMYGFGSVLAPKITAELVEGGGSWSVPFLWAIPAVFCLLFMAARLEALPSGVRENENNSSRLSFSQLLMVAIFCIFVVGEVLLSMWMVSYLTDYQKLPVGEAAVYASAFFLVMGFSRLAAALWVTARMEHLVILCSIVGALLFFYLGYNQNQLWAFALCGVLGPFYPLVMARATRDHPEQAKLLTLWIIVGIGASMAVFHFSIGVLSDALGIRQAYVLPPFLAALSLVLYLLYEHGSYENGAKVNRVLR